MRFTLGQRGMGSLQHNLPAVTSCWLIALAENVCEKREQTVRCILSLDFIALPTKSISHLKRQRKRSSSTEDNVYRYRFTLLGTCQEPNELCNCKKLLSDTKNIMQIRRPS